MYNVMHSVQIEPLPVQVACVCVYQYGSGLPHPNCNYEKTVLMYVSGGDVHAHVWHEV